MVFYLSADHAGPNDLHGLNNFVLLELSGNLGALFTVFQGGLDRDELVTFLKKKGPKKLECEVVLHTKRLKNSDR